MSNRVSVLFGPNLNLLGEREPSFYGVETFADHIRIIEEAAAARGLIVEVFQTNHEGVLVDKIHETRESADAIIINPGAFSHYAWAIHDALKSVGVPCIELHLSNPQSRESWRHTSVVSPVVIGTISGFGSHGYGLAMDALIPILREGR